MMFCLKRSLRPTNAEGWHAAGDRPPHGQFQIHNGDLGLAATNAVTSHGGDLSAGRSGCSGQGRNGEAGEAPLSETQTLGLRRRLLCVTRGKAPKPLLFFLP